MWQDMQEWVSIQQNNFISQKSVHHRRYIDQTKWLSQLASASLVIDLRITMSALGSELLQGRDLIALIDLLCVLGILHVSWRNECLHLFSIFLWVVILFFPLLFRNQRGEETTHINPVPCTNHVHIQDKRICLLKNVTRMTLVVFSVATMLPRWLSR